MNRERWLVLLAAIVLLVTGCAVPLEPRLQGISEFKPHGAREGTKAGITLGLDIENPNRYKIKVLAYDLDIFVNGSKVGRAEHKGKQVMTGMGTSTIRLDVDTDIRQMFGGLLGALGGLLGDEPSVEIKVSGNVLARAKGIQKRVPVTIEKRYLLGDSFH